MIYRCSDGRISFAKNLARCGMNGCNNPVDAISPANIEWFYKLSPDGLAMNEADLHRIIDDRSMPAEVKGIIKETFPHLRKKGFRFW